MSTPSESAPREVAQDEHKQSAQIKHNLSTEARTALEFIASELKEGREPTSRGVAEKVGMTPTGLGMMLSKHGIKPQNTKRQMKAVKIYTKPMLARIEEILETTK